VIIQQGTSPGLLFELERAVAQLAPQRLLIALPGLLRPKEFPDWLTRRHTPSKLEVYEHFRERANALFPQHLPRSIGSANFICFADDWTAHLLAPRPWRPYNLSRPCALRESLRPFCDRLGIHLSRTRVVIEGFFIVLILSLFGVALGWILLDSLFGLGP
jgi:hypothetical protein